MLSGTKKVYVAFTLQDGQIPQALGRLIGALRREAVPTAVPGMMSVDVHVPRSRARYFAQQCEDAGADLASVYH